MVERAPTTALHETADETENSFDVAVIGGGGAAEALVGSLEGSGLRVLVIEEHRVGGTCPFVACMPSKALLHDAEGSTRWRRAIQRRDELVDHLDDQRHADQVRRQGAHLVRGHARLIDEHTIEVGPDGHQSEQYHAEHIVLATGSTPVIPQIEGIDDLGEHLWTSDDALTTDDRPVRLMVIGGGPIGCELAHLFAGFDTEVHLIDTAERAFPELPVEIGEIVDDGLRSAGVRVNRGTAAVRFERLGGNVRITLDNDASVVTDRVLVSIGRRANIGGLGLERLGLDPEAPLPVDEVGRVDCPGSVWAIGDVAGKGQYTHLANHHAHVVADHLTSDPTSQGQRRLDDVVIPACIFTRPPVMMVGPTPDELGEDAVWVSAKLSEVARWSTDALGDGFLTVAVDRSTRCVLAAHGAGASFDELSAAFVTAIDGRVPIDRLAKSMWPFPTVGELLGPIYRRALDALAD
ncbi:MAG TPA: NAD(P)/FAD-dependent oxidoreductase [Ilumatobacteraceae bacterium]|nr:NAD(P)/FAD-dependent oxidoreductase [Ilumatobacteraceae bacterium]